MSSHPSSAESIAYASPRASATGLLVSVRNAGEARAAALGGADVIDIKEPAAGPLGAATLCDINRIVDAVASSQTVTVAAGELVDDFPLERLPAGVAIAKLGLAKTSGTDWRSDSSRAVSRLPGSAAAALVAYADWQAAASPLPEEILSHAAAVGCRGIVLDTWSKVGGCSLDLLDVARLTALIDEAHSLGLLIVLAGSITLERVEEAASYGPTFVGVRGAACVSGRAGSVDTDRVRSLAQQLGACRRGR